MQGRHLNKRKNRFLATGPQQAMEPTQEKDHLEREECYEQGQFPACKRPSQVPTRLLDKRSLYSPSSSSSLLAKLFMVDPVSQRQRNSLWKVINQFYPERNAGINLNSFDPSMITVFAMSQTNSRSLKLFSPVSVILISPLVLLPQEKVGICLRFEDKLIK